MLEKDVERYLCDQVKKFGGKAYKFTSPGNAGMPDRLVVFPGGHIAFVEVKAPGKQLRPIQQEKRNELRALSCQYFVVDSKDSAKEFIAWAVRQ